MPLYAYNCLECKELFTIRHSYKAEGVKCIKCKSENIKKNLSDVLQRSKKCYNIKEATGNKVHEAIKEGKEELTTYKKERKNRVYKEK